MRDKISSSHNITELLMPTELYPSVTSMHWLFCKPIISFLCCFCLNAYGDLGCLRDPWSLVLTPDVRWGASLVVKDFRVSLQLLTADLVHSSHCYLVHSSHTSTAHLICCHQISKCMPNKAKKVKNHLKLKLVICVSCQNKPYWISCLFQDLKSCPQAPR